MELAVKMPDLSTTDSAIKLVRWLAQPGDLIKRGQPLCEIETDKAASNVESIATGILKEYRAQPGDMVAVGQEIALFETETAPVANSLPVPTAPKSSGLFARNRAAIPDKKTAVPASGIALTQSQQTVGRRLQASKQSIPHFYLQASANAEGVIRRRLAMSPKPVWEAFFVVAIAKILPDFERIRWRLRNEQVTAEPASDIGVAIDARGDLFVAAIAATAKSSIEEISRAIRAQAGKIEEDAADARGIKPCALTITNLGNSCVESFTAIINPPEVAILALGKIGPAAIVQDGQVIVQNRVALTLSADHRVINGKYGADFLGAIVRQIESF